MELGLNAPTKAPIYAHPNGNVLVSLIGLFGGVLTVLMTRSLASQVENLLTEGKTQNGEVLEVLWPLRATLASFAIGTVVGLATMLVQKQLLRSRIRFYADFFTMPLLERLRWPVLITNLQACLPMPVGSLVAVALACVLRISPWPAFFGPSICFFLAYPEQKLIYETAKSRIALKDAQK